MKIKIDELDLSLQTRAGTDADTIKTYAEAMADGAQFPDVTVFTDGAHYWLADGFHRVMALKQLGKGTVAADVRKGTSDDAVLFGGTANNKQGKRPTRADVQHFLEMVWERREAIFGGTPTGGNLAEKCGVSRRTGETFVREKLAEMPKVPIRPTAQVAQLPTRPKRSGDGVPTAQVAQLPTRPKRSGDGVPTAQVAQLTVPVRPEKLVGKNGKMYAVNPTPKRPEKPVRQIPVDRFGVQIPVNLSEAFEASPLPDILSCISRARVALRKGLEEKDPAFAAVRQDALVNLNNAYSFVASAEVWCVCRVCQGNGCKACHSRGWQTEEEYKRNPPEMKAEGGAK